MVTVDDIYIVGVAGDRPDNVVYHVWVRGFGLVVVPRGTRADMVAAIQAFLDGFMPLADVIDD